MGEILVGQIWRQYNQTLNKMKIISITFAICIFNKLCCKSVTGTQDFVVISENEEIQMGREYNAQILRQNPFIKIKSYKIMCNPLANLLLREVIDLISYIGLLS